MSRHAIRLLILLGAVLALGCGLPGLLLWHFSSDAHALANAQARWAARPFFHYRLVVTYSAFGPCRQDVEVHDERVIAVFQNTCPRQAMTVSDLFAEIKRYRAALGGRCGPNGCGCDGTIGVDAAYDPRWGYPRQIRVRLRPAERWRYLDHWRWMVLGMECRRVGFDGATIRVVSLTPLP